MFFVCVHFLYLLLSIYIIVHILYIVNTFDKEIQFFAK
uniref:Uncharacterized protein n=1 Tax=Siphoviridae sp. ct1mp9 TaxID=2826274 RepID=A0A8S5N9R6_9CAUD|nr:MAG TPA: hypothetical protein [Siphoviridae sp. ct1mp9]